MAKLTQLMHVNHVEDRGERKGERERHNTWMTFVIRLVCLIFLVVFYTLRHDEAMNSTKNNSNSHPLLNSFSSRHPMSTAAPLF